MNRTKFRLVLLLTVGMMLVATAETLAARRGRYAPSRGRAMQVRVNQMPSRAPTYRYPGPSVMSSYYRFDPTYPRYTGGFHARYFQEYGIPSGDRGIRGLAW